MSQVGVTQQYKELLGQAKAIPFLNTESYDLDHYVVGKALDGLFHVVGEQEAQIRANPAARTTELLKEVFGQVAVAPQRATTPLATRKQSSGTALAARMGGPWDPFSTYTRRAGSGCETAPA